MFVPDTCCVTHEFSEWPDNVTLVDENHCQVDAVQKKTDSEYLHVEVAFVCFFITALAADLYAVARLSVRLTQSAFNAIKVFRALLIIIRKKNVLVPVGLRTSYLQLIALSRLRLTGTVIWKCQ